MCLGISKIRKNPQIPYGITVLVGTTKVPVGLSESFTSERENTTEKYKSPNQKRRMCNYWYKPAASALVYVVWLFQDGAARPNQEKVQLTPSLQAWSSRDLCLHLDAWDVVTPDKQNDSLKFWLVL